MRFYIKDCELGSGGVNPDCRPEIIGPSDLGIWVVGPLLLRLDFGLSLGNIYGNGSPTPTQVYINPADKKHS